MFADPWCTRFSRKRSGAGSSPRKGRDTGVSDAGASEAAVSEAGASEAAVSDAAVSEGLFLDTHEWCSDSGGTRFI